MSLFEVLKNWDDRESIQSGIERAGFNVHSVYQQELKALTERSGYDASDLVKYWNELAREWVACIGRVDSRRRIFHSDVGYRSKYLDELAEDRKIHNIPDTVALHPGERIFNEIVGSSGLGRALTADAETLKNFGDDGEISSVINKRSGIEDLRGYLYRYLSMHGFTKSGSQLKRKLENGLILTAGIEKSNPLRMIQLLVFLKISIRGSVEDIYFNDFHRLVPGFKYNALVLSDVAVSYGLRAHASIIGEVARSFSKL